MVCLLQKRWEPELLCSRLNEYSSLEFADFKKEWRAQAASVLKGISDEAKAAGVQCETKQTAHGSPDEAILAMANEKGCDLIVMASHGERGDCRRNTW